MTFHWWGESSAPSILTCSHQLFFVFWICLIFSCFAAFSSFLLWRMIDFIGHWGSGRLVVRKCGLGSRPWKCRWPSERLLAWGLLSGTDYPQITSRTKLTTNTSGSPFRTPFYASEDWICYETLVFAEVKNARPLVEGLKERMSAKINEPFCLCQGPRLGVSAEAATRLFDPPLVLDRFTEIQMPKKHTRTPQCPLLHPPSGSEGQFTFPPSLF